MEVIFIVGILGIAGWTYAAVLSRSRSKSSPLRSKNVLDMQEHHSPLNAATIHGAATPVVCALDGKRMTDYRILPSRDTVCLEHEV